MSQTYHRAAPIDGLSEGQARAIEIAGLPVLLCLSEGRPHAVVNRCTHMGSPLTGGRVRRGSIICPDHGAIFNLDSGKCAGGVGYPDLRVLPSRVVDGWIEIACLDG